MRTVFRSGNLSIGNERYQLPINNGANHLHGGTGLSHRNWKLTPLEIKHETALLLEYWSPDGEDGYPGNLQAKVTYILSNNNEWIIDYEATTDRPTVVNLTQHNFYNLAGEGNGDILDHELMINADRITPVDNGLIPTGELRNVEGTPFDSERSQPSVRELITKTNNYNLGTAMTTTGYLQKKGSELSHAATAIDPKSQRKLEVWTTEPGLQLYTGNFLDSTDKGKSGKTYPYRSAFCLETQHFPDSPNRPGFPSTLLSPGETYHQQSVFKFRIG